jgi:hypothetical protein
MDRQHYVIRGGIELDAVLAEGLASSDEAHRVIEDLYALAHNPRTVLSFPRIVQAWGYRPLV